ncbi:MAG: hypothetical protein LBL35_00190, partial [Clostridiales bacterium]|nr:hypothetical protein [Clostridiales bacterium]
MTGYGRGERAAYDRRIVVEIKSVNHRYNDINMRLPKILNAHEDKLRKKLSGEISRGKTDVYARLESHVENDVNITVNKE